MYFSGIRNDSSLGEKSLTLGSRWWRYMKFPDMNQKSLIASPASGNESWDGGRDLWFSKKINVIFPSNWSMPYHGGCSQVLISSKRFNSSVCDWKNKFSLFGKYHLFRIESFRVDFRCVHRLQLLKVCNQYVTLPNKFSTRTMRIRRTIQVRLSFQIDGFLTGPSQLQVEYSTNEPNGIVGTLNGCPKRLS